MKLQLNRQQLKTIAIISMVIDHTAWGFVDFYSPLGQLLHVMGRLTIPIMCFFIAEGFRKTSDLKAYIYRMATFALITMIPFYIFFHEEYDYRQNIIFDLLLGLLVLTTLESKLKKWQKCLLVALLFVISMTVGGWPVTPIWFILSFYYGKTFREKAKWFVISDVVTVLFMMAFIVLNGVYHFAKYEWVWWDKTYLLGFMLALPLLYCYNGEKGKEYGGRYFFYVFYPCHFLVLAAIRAIVCDHTSAYNIYLMLHIAALFVAIILLVFTLRCRASKGQNAISVLLLTGIIYILGFILEILSDTVQGYYLAVIVQYFGEVILLVALTYYITVLCHLNIPFIVYIVQIIIGVLIMYGLVTTLDNGFFYQEIAVNYDGAFPHLQLIYGTGFYLTIAYIACISVFVICACAYLINTGTHLDKKRAEYTIYAVLLLWLPYVLKLFGLTGGYEVPGLGIAFSGIVFYMILIKYGFLDSIALASETALDHGKEGILVFGEDYRVQYFNKRIEDIFGKLSKNVNLKENTILSHIIDGTLIKYTVNERVYEFELEELREGNSLQGYMLWVIDSTEHYEALQRVREMAIKDSMTQLYNRTYFQELLDKFLHAGGTGTFIMVDMDNFKKVNDTYGHCVGDEVINAFADVLKSYGEEKLLGCRVGGDEFAAFILSVTENEALQDVLRGIMKQFDDRLDILGYHNYTSLSIGAIVCDQSNPEETRFSTLYTKADEVLYQAKNAGKNQFIITR